MGGVELFNHLFDRTADDCASTSATSAITSPDIQRRIPFEICFSGIIQLPHCRSFFIKKVGFGSITLNRVLILWNIEVFHNNFFRSLRRLNRVKAFNICCFYHLTYTFHHNRSIFIKDRISVLVHLRFHCGDSFFTICCCCCYFGFPNFTLNKFFGCFYHFGNAERKSFISTSRIAVSSHDIERPVKVILAIVQIFIYGTGNIVYGNVVRVTHRRFFSFFDFILSRFLYAFQIIGIGVPKIIVQNRNNHI